MQKDLTSRAKELVKGAYDLHIHPLPSHIPRSIDDDDLMREAAAIGMAGVVIKSHYETTNSRAIMANRRFPALGVKAFGAVALNEPVGGLNPYAVESTLQLGGKMVYLPTLDAVSSINVINFGIFERKGIRVLDEDGKLRNNVYEIMEIVRHHDACLSTGHISLEEAYAVCKEGAKMKVRMLLAHPEWQGMRFPLEAQIAIADLGVTVEKCWLNIIEKACNAEYLAHTIRELGSHRIIMVTDHGQLKNEHPAQAMISFIKAMLEQGIPEKSIRDMVYTLPRRIIGE